MKLPRLIHNFLNFRTTMDNNYDKKIAEFRKAIEYGELKHCPPEWTCKKRNMDNFLQPKSP